MASASRIQKGISLEEFLKLPEIDQRPYFEYLDGAVEKKVSAKTNHSVITDDFLAFLNGYARPRRLGRAFPELRCTFAGRSIVPDVVFLLHEHIQVDGEGRFAAEVFTAPDIHIEIMSPGQSRPKTHRKLILSTAHGCSLGLLVHPENETINVYRPGQSAQRLDPQEEIDFSPVLPGLRLAVVEVFSWLVYIQPPADPRPDHGAEPA